MLKFLFLTTAIISFIVVIATEQVIANSNNVGENVVHPSCSSNTEAFPTPNLDSSKIANNESVIIIKGNHKIARLTTVKELEETREQEDLVRRAEKTNSFTSVSVDVPWGLPVEVQIIGSLPRGIGSAMYDLVTKLQGAHPEYILAFNEGSAKIMNTNFNFDKAELNDPTAVYTFSVDKEDLVFHRHEGHRCITGMSGSGGAIMKFSTVDHITAKKDAKAFVEGMFIVEIPADSIFVLRFNGMVYHQFGPMDPNFAAFWAVSVHTNEKGGDLSEELLQKVLNGEGNIPLLTEPIPDAVDALLKSDSEIVNNIKRFRLERLE